MSIIRCNICSMFCILENIVKNIRKNLLNKYCQNIASFWPPSLPDELFCKRNVFFLSSEVEWRSPDPEAQGSKIETSRAAVNQTKTVPSLRTIINSLAKYTNFLMAPLTWPSLALRLCDTRHPFKCYLCKCFCL